MKINILHMYPDLLNLYGDRGNIACMEQRLRWRGIDVETRRCTCREDNIDIENTDIIFIGGGSDREQKIVCDRLLEKKNMLSEYVESGGVLVAVCGGYQLLGKYYKLADEIVKGLEILDIYTEQGSPRLIGNVVLESDFVGQKIVGFENHGGRTFIGDHTPLGKVVVGHGNDGVSGAEGVVYKNVTATYLHGPLLPKNPQLCDRILTQALKRRYSDFGELAPLDDSLENRGNEYIVNRFCR